MSADNPLYGPLWFSQQVKAVQDEVMAWLSEHGISPEQCAGFDLAITGTGHDAKTYATAYLYHLDGFGHGQYDEAGQPLMDEPESFRPRWLPAVLSR